MVYYCLMPKLLLNFLMFISTYTCETLLPSIVIGCYAGITVAGLAVWLALYIHYIPYIFEGKKKLNCAHAHMA